MIQVFLVQHVRDEDGSQEDVKIIGIYSDKAQAEAAIARLVSLPGFRDTQHGFYIDAYDLNRDHWEEGFGFD